MDKDKELLEYKIVLNQEETEIVSKKSRFIATLCPVQSVEEAHAFIDEIKKKYWDAKHHCSAYVIGKKGETTRCNDDGEPSGTAGKPILEVLIGEEIKNIVVVVTRYFGGVLLGTGGLVRAYSKATKEVLRLSEVGIMRYGVMVELTTDYNFVGKIQYILAKNAITILKSEYKENVLITVLCPIAKKDKCIHEIIEVTTGKTTIIETDSRYFIDKDPLI